MKVLSFWPQRFLFKSPLRNTNQFDVKDIPPKKLYFGFVCCYLCNSYNVFVIARLNTVFCRSSKIYWYFALPGWYITYISCFRSSVKGIVRSFHQINRKKNFFCGSNLIGIKLYISNQINHQILKIVMVPIFTPLKFNKSHLIFL